NEAGVGPAAAAPDGVPSAYSSNETAHSSGWRARQSLVPGARSLVNAARSSAGTASGNVAESPAADCGASRAVRGAGAAGSCAVRTVRGIDTGGGAATVGWADGAVGADVRPHAAPSESATAIAAAPSGARIVRRQRAAPRTVRSAPVQQRPGAIDRLDPERVVVVRDDAGEPRHRVRVGDLRER